MSILSQRLKELRKEHQLSQESLSRALGLTRTAYANYEQGTREPSIDTLIAFCNFYDIPADYLIGRTDSY